MSLRRWALVGLLPLGVVGTVGAIEGHQVAQASPRTAVLATATKPIKLPAGVKQKANGKFMQRICPRCNAFRILPDEWQPGMDLPPRKPQAGASGMTPTDLLDGYSLSAVANTGGIVAILDAPDKTALADVNAYRKEYGMTALTECANNVPSATSPCFAQVATNGGTASTGDSGEDDGETGLDMDMISAACPMCSILLVQISENFCESDFVAGAATAAKLGANAVSISIGGPEATDPNVATLTEDASTPNPCPAEATWIYDAPGPYSTPGTLVFAASGDFAYDLASEELTTTLGGASPSYPSSSPYIISVGGTSLNRTGTGTFTFGEGVWADGTYSIGAQDTTTSGCSTEFEMPPWQATALSGSGCTKRATADVSAAATYYSSGEEIAIGSYSSGSWEPVEGTSAASPMVAAIYTRLGLTTEASNDLSWTYTNAAAFNDVGSSAYPVPSGLSKTDAPSGTNCGILCTVGTGWDGPSGVGSPNGTKLAALTKTTTGPVPYPDAGFPGPTGPSSSSSGGTTTDDAGGAGTSSGSTDDGGGTVGTSSGSPTSDDAGGGTTSSSSSSGGGIVIGGGEDAGLTTEDAGSGNGFSGSGGNSGGGCSVVTGTDSTSNLGLFGASFGFVALLGARRRRNRNK